MIVCRIIGWVFLLAALAALGYEATQAISTGTWHMVALGELWFKLNVASLNAAQAGIQRYVAPWLWEPVITTVLLWPGWVVFGAPGILLTWLCRRRSNHHRMPRRLG